MQRWLMGKALPRFEALSVRFCTSDLRFNLDGVFSRAFCMYIIYLLFEIRFLFRDFHFSFSLALFSGIIVNRRLSLVRRLRVCFYIV